MAAALSLLTVDYHVNTHPHPDPETSSGLTAALCRLVMLPASLTPQHLTTAEVVLHLKGGGSYGCKLSQSSRHPSARFAWNVPQAHVCGHITPSWWLCFWLLWDIRL